MLLNKLRVYLERSKKHLQDNLSLESPETYSYWAGKIETIDYVLGWLDDLPDIDKLNHIIKFVEDSGSEDTYSYMGFDYQELLQLRKELSI